MPDRLTRSRQRGARLPPGAVCVDRGTIFGNPWAAGDPDATFWWPRGAAHGWQITLNYGRAMDAATCVGLYRDWLGTGMHPTIPTLTALGRTTLHTDLTARRALILSRLPALRGRDLACYCAHGAPCHATVLLEIANA